MAVQGVRAVSPERASRIRRRLLRQARLFDDPEAYAAGVLDALEAATRPTPGPTLCETGGASRPPRSNEQVPG